MAAACAPRSASVRASRSRGDGHDQRKCARERANRLLRSGGGDRTRIRRVHGFHGVRHGIHPAGRARVRGQRQRQHRVIDHQPRRHGRIPAGGLRVSAGDAPDARHLGAGVGRGHRDNRQRPLARDGLGESDGRAAADRQQRVRTDSIDVGHRALDAVGRHVHRRDVADAGEPVTKLGAHVLDRRVAPGRRHKQRPGDVRACRAPCPGARSLPRRTRLGFVTIQR